MAYNKIWHVQVSFFSPTMFLINVSYCEGNIRSTGLVFANDVSSFFFAHDKYPSLDELNKNSETIKNWFYQWKM